MYSTCGTLEIGMVFVTNSCRAFRAKLDMILLHGNGGTRESHLYPDSGTISTSTDVASGGSGSNG